jgi:hypothetical protein
MQICCIVAAVWMSCRWLRVSRVRSWIPFAVSKRVPRGSGAKAVVDEKIPGLQEAPVLHNSNLPSPF